MSVHPTAAAGFADATAYENARPGFSPQVVAALELAPGHRVADVGAGTGKLTRVLPGEVTAVEPLAGMRTLFHAPQARLVAGTAEALPFAASSFDAVCAAQCFHWFDALSALAELHRVLIDGGRLLVVFNVRDESVSWMRGIGEALESCRGDTPAHSTSHWREALSNCGLFQPAVVRDVDNPQPADEALLRQRLASISFVALLEPDRRKRLVDHCARLFVESGSDVIPQTCRIYAATRIP